jgi:hypothetical protein
MVGFNELELRLPIEWSATQLALEQEARHGVRLKTDNAREPLEEERLETIAGTWPHHDQGGLGRLPTQ